MVVISRTRYQSPRASPKNRFLTILFITFNILQTSTASWLQYSNKRPTVLLTGGTGYIGSHVAHTLLNTKYQVAIIDNLENSHKSRISEIEKHGVNRIAAFENVDIRNQSHVCQVMSRWHSMLNIVAVIHLAGLKSPVESQRYPGKYWSTNVKGLQNVLHCMRQSHIKTLVFSSSATVYGSDGVLEEEIPLSPKTVYGLTKAIGEELLQNACRAWGLKAMSLRYFNPVGGIFPETNDANLFGYIYKVLAGLRDELKVFGGWKTSDGTGVRDYIHVMDLAEAHIRAIDALIDTGGKGGIHTVLNIGTSTGHSVLEVVNRMERITGRALPYRMLGPRPGDVAVAVANATRAGDQLGWAPRRTLADSLEDVWRWVLAANSSISYTIMQSSVKLSQLQSPYSMSRPELYSRIEDIS